MKRAARTVIGRAALVVLALLAIAPAGAPAGASDPPRQARDVGAAASVPEVTPAALGAMLAARSVVLVNVHVPYAGEIPGTRLFIPYDAVEKNLAQLPDKRAAIVLYCRSGAMSAIAARALRRLGYTRVSSLAGGMVAWEDAGFPLTRRPR